MRERTHRLLNLYSGEGKQALVFAILGFVLFFAIFLGYKLSDTLFLINLSAKRLPLAYGVIASILICSALLIILAYHRHTARTVFFRVVLIALIFYSAITVACVMGIVQASSWSWFILKVCTQIIWVQMLSCFWTFLDEFYHFQDAKRIYTIFNSSLYLGLTTAGLVIRSNAFGIIELFSAIVVLLALVLFIAPRVVSRFPTVPDDSESEMVQQSEGQALSSFFKVLITSRFSFYLMVANLLIYLLWTTTEYGYFTSFQNYFGVAGHTSSSMTSSQEFTRFYGTCLAIAGAFNLIAGWFLYSRFILRFGVTTLILLTPLCFIATYTIWPFDPTIAAPLLGFFIVESLLPAIEDSDFNILLNAVPLKIKSKVRILIESFSEPTGMLLTSLLLSLPFLDFRFLGLILSCICLGITLTVRMGYYSAIFKNLKDHSLHLYRTVQDWLLLLPKREKKACQERLIMLLSHPDPEFQRLATEALFQEKKVHLIKKALESSDAFYPTTKILFLKLADSSPYHSEAFILDAIAKWQEGEQDLDLLSHIDFFLAKHGLLHPDKAQYTLSSPQLFQRGAAILALQHSFAHQTLSNVTINRALALSEINKLIESENEEELSMGLKLLGIEGSQQNIEILIDYLKHPSLHVAKAAASALGECLDLHDLRHAKVIIDEIASRPDSEFRIFCFKALSKIGHTSLIRPIIGLAPYLRPNETRALERTMAELGLKTIPSLVSIITDVELPDRTRVLAGKILAQLSLAQLNASIPQIIKKEILRAYFHFYWGHTLLDEYQGYDLTLLKEGMLSSYQSAIDFIIQLLGASRWIEDSELIVYSLRSKNPKIISQAIETLEMCCERGVFRLLYPLIQDLPLKEKLKCCEKHISNSCTLPEILDKLEKMANTLDLVLALTWKYRLDLPDWRIALRKQMARRDSIFHNFAYELLET
jgi:hypothetical protein